jgi:hypothetical protein
MLRTASLQVALKRKVMPSMLFGGLTDANFLAVKEWGSDGQDHRKFVSRHQNVISKIIRGPSLFVERHLSSEPCEFGSLSTAPLLLDQCW